MRTIIGTGAIHITTDGIHIIPTTPIIKET
jgi:hypothetical protein